MPYYIKPNVLLQKIWSWTRKSSSKVWMLLLISRIWMYAKKRSILQPWL